MDNRKGKSDINIGSSTNAGKFSVSNIGLLELKAALFNNQGGSRNIGV